MQPALSGAAPAGSGPAASADSGGKRSIRIKLGVSKLTGSQVPAPSRSLAQPSGDIDGAIWSGGTVHALDNPRHSRTRRYIAARTNAARNTVHLTSSAVLHCCRAVYIHAHRHAQHAR